MPKVFHTVVIWVLSLGIQCGVVSSIVCFWCRVCTVTYCKCLWQGEYYLFLNTLRPKYDSRQYLECPSAGFESLVRRKAILQASTNGRDDKKISVNLDIFDMKILSWRHFIVKIFFTLAALSCKSSQKCSCCMFCLQMCFCLYVWLSLLLMWYDFIC